MIKRISLDIETTGLDYKLGHKIVEIGCVELENNYPTGKVFQQYINPGLEMDEDVIKIHGLTNEFLSDKPFFSEVAEQFLEFISEAELVIHNARFDLGFLNYELENLKKPSLKEFKVIDTLFLARKMFPGASNSLDALCKRYDINLSKREKHGALLDAELLADVFLEMNGGRQQGISLEFEKNKTPKKIIKDDNVSLYCKKVVMPSNEEEASHRQVLDSIKNNFW